LQSQEVIDFSAFQEVLGRILVPLVTLDARYTRNIEILPRTSWNAEKLQTSMRIFP